MHASREPGERSAGLAEVGLCGRCGYRGEGLPYFSKGSHVALLVGATVLTAGVMGAGGIAYYLLRREHRVCPRCGSGWGRFGEAARARGRSPRPTEVKVPGFGREHVKRGWSLALFVAAAAIVAVGIAGGGAPTVILAALAVAGGVFLHLSANRDREARRAALVSSLQLPVVQLAARRGGRLTVSEVAADLGWTLRRSEKVLQSLDDGLRVDSEVTDEGVIVYEFRELLGRSGAGDPPSLPSA